MLGVAFGIGVLLALVGGTAAHGCGECHPSHGGTGETGDPARDRVEGTWDPLRPPAASASGEPGPSPSSCPKATGLRDAAAPGGVRQGGRAAEPQRPAGHEPGRGHRYRDQQVAAPADTAGGREERPER